MTETFIQNILKYLYMKYKEKIVYFNSELFKNFTCLALGFFFILFNLPDIVNNMQHCASHSGGI